MWIFGYGSLIWKVDFEYSERLEGYVKGYERRFWQASTDHRGVPGKPGRVVTLIPSADPEARVWGVAYRLPEENRSSILEHLDFREKGGYSRLTLHFYPCGAQEGDEEAWSAQDNGVSSGHHEQRCGHVDVVAYVGGRGNEMFTGPTDVEQVAAQIREASGPSGSNKEYLLKLSEAVRRLAAGRAARDETHLFQVEAALLRLEQTADRASS